jgi:hypothetical protein
MARTTACRNLEIPLEELCLLCLHTSRLHLFSNMSFRPLFYCFSFSSSDEDWISEIDRHVI